MKVVYGRVLEGMGMTEKTAKGTATRHVNKVGVDRDENGFVSVDNAIEMLEASYLGEATVSKYKENAISAIADLKAGAASSNKELSVPMEKAKPKTSIFIAVKVLNAVKLYATEKGNKELLDLIDITSATLEKEAEDKKQNKIED